MNAAKDIHKPKINIEYLKQYKQEKKLTNKQLADMIGIHESTMSRVLRGQKGVGYKFISGAFHLEDIDFKKLFGKR